MQVTFILFGTVGTTMPQIRINASEDLSSRWDVFKSMVKIVQEGGPRPTNDEALEILFQLAGFKEGMELDDALELVEAYYE